MKRRRRSRIMGSPPLPRGHWPTGRRLASLCRGLEHTFKTCAGPGSPCRDAAQERALAAGCSWAVKRLTPRYSGRLVKY